MNPFRRHPDAAPILAPPPLLFGVCLLAGWGAGELCPLPLAEGSLGFRLGVALPFFLVSLAIGLWAIPLFRAHGTPVDPHKPTAALIHGGPYRWSRNPLYLALLCAFAGFTLLLDSLWLLALLPVFALLLHFGVVRKEEVYLEARFGEEYRSYRARVRRWL